MSLDLTQHPPRSARCRLGGFILLPRLLDKGRAALAGKNGSYNYGCPLDQHFFRFTGIAPEALKEELATGKGDGEILGWIHQNSTPPRNPWEIQSWSNYHLHRPPDSDAETLEYFAHAVRELSVSREDINTWVDLLDLDDYVSFGGKA